MAAEALLGIVIGNLATLVNDELSTFLGVDSQIKNLTGYLTAIRAVLQDADERQITSHAVKLWLQKLTDAAHVLDDILEECSMQLGSQNSAASSLTRFHPSNVRFSLKIGRRMKEITQRFHAIDEERRMFDFRAGIIVPERQQEDDEWRQTTSVIFETRVYGRDQDRERIVEFLCGCASNNEDLSIYPIVGIGGYGKTTLAQLVFNDDRVTSHFDLRIWVCVSDDDDDFQIRRILLSILESVAAQDHRLSTLESLQKKVQEVLLSKRYLLVLDDVWNEDPITWEKLKSLLQSRTGTKGSSVLVTTRLENVASIMGTHPTHHLSDLSDDDNLSLFKHHAFGSNGEENEELVAIGKEIVRKCAGSPLASKALGSLLRTTREVNQWHSVKESKFWDIPAEKQIMRALKLSYFSLKSSLRQCFSFCAIFPKDYEIGKEQLIHLWIANGFIQSRESLEVEVVGNEVWNELYRRSFFQDVKIDVFNDITFKMHDLFHDLAQSIIGEECMVTKNASLTNLSSRLHHICYYDSNQPVHMACFKKVESLRTFLDLNPNYAPPQNFHQLPSISPLRALCTSAYQLSSLKKLAHLRYLHIFQSKIITLPESICTLQKLQILKLEHCELLRCLPKCLTQLKGLRHLVIKECWSLKVMPPYIGKLACLKTLSTFIVDSKSGHRLAELHNLQLGGELHIRSLENVNNETDAKQANLICKKDPNRLYLSWGINANSQGAVDAEGILEALQPHSNIKSLGLNSYQGIRFPTWMRNPSVMQGLVHVIFFNCTNCEQLLPLGKLPHLTTLTLNGMEYLKCIDDDSYDDVSFKAFKSLKKLYLLGLPNLERILNDEGVEMLPLLSELTVIRVPKLKLPRLPSVETLLLYFIEDMASFFENLPHLKDLFFGNINKMNVLPSELASFSGLEGLLIDSCDELESFSEHVLQGLTSLRTLKIRNCNKLKSLSNGVEHLCCLEHLEIKHCPELVVLPSNMNRLTTLRSISIKGGRQMPEGLTRVPFLKTLSLNGIDGLDSLPEWLGEMTSLQQLEICMFPELRSLPSSFSQLTNLQELTICDCLKLEKRCKKGTGEDWPKIAHVPQILIDRKFDLTISDTIKTLWIVRKDLLVSKQQEQDVYLNSFLVLLKRVVSTQKKRIVSTEQ
ncbi:hypothetical protein RIF29_28624 [Crotalaria pallida]|uniref:Uncharacterized protein n=1 Tax=Crotalaria pallida TaxID=3830 RepID=A0AAN9HT50_CROPI